VRACEEAIGANPLNIYPLYMPGVVSAFHFDSNSRQISSPDGIVSGGKGPEYFSAVGPVGSGNDTSRRATLDGCVLDEDKKKFIDGVGWA
jgi:hypothetical protein